VILDRISDAVNPIVIKELRQAVQSRFVVAVLLLFLLLQLLFMGVYLAVSGIQGGLDSAEFQAGRPVFGTLHGIMLATCLLFLPAYSGFRLGAERSDVNVDLLFISTLRPRAIIAGKFVAAVILAVLIFSTCAPFMAFSYFLRGIDLPVIFFAVAVDFVAVLLMVMLALFLAVVPANRPLKILLGLGGLLVGLFVFSYTISGTIEMLAFGLADFLEGPEFWVICLVSGLLTAGIVGFLFTASVGLLSPLSANRTLPLRLWLTVFCLGTGLVIAVCSSAEVFPLAEGPMCAWLLEASCLLSLCLLIAVNEREQWAPRVARSIPRRWWLRPWAFVLYSGAAGGVIWVALLFAACWLTLLLYQELLPAARQPFLVPPVQALFTVMGALLLYIYCYCLTAVFLRNTLVNIQPVFTWVLALALIALGSLLPFLATMLLHRGEGDFWSYYAWLLTCPGVGMAVVGGSIGASEVAWTFVAAWAVLVTLLNAPWFVKQMRRFRPYAAGAVREPAPLILAVTPMDVTKTAR
jgi:hypothetical protein